MAGAVGKAITAIRSGVIKNPGEAVQLVLRTSPPADGFFFGDPSSQVHNSLYFAVVFGHSSEDYSCCAPGHLLIPPSLATTLRYNDCLLPRLFILLWADA